MEWIRVSILLLLSAGLGCRADAQTIGIDVRARSGACPGDASGGGVVAVVASGRTGPAVTVPQVAVTLARLDKAAYHEGEVVEFEVILKNVSNTTLEVPALPRSAVCQALKAGDETLKHATVELVIGDGNERSGLIGVVALWRNREPSSSVSLAPGATVNVRATTFWRPLAVPGGLPEQASARIRVEGIGNMSAVSANSALVRTLRGTPVK
jgi:hypothetical protein